MPEAKTEEKPTYNKVTGLWKGRGKVAFSAFIKEDTLLPAGSKLLVFSNEKSTEDNRHPEYNMVYTFDVKQK